MLDRMEMRIKYLSNSFSLCKNKLCAIPHICKCEKNGGVKVPEVLRWLLYSANGKSGENLKGRRGWCSANGRIKMEGSNGVAQSSILIKQVAGYCRRLPVINPRGKQ